MFRTEDKRGDEITRPRLWKLGWLPFSVFGAKKYRPILRRPIFHELSSPSMWHTHHIPVNRNISPGLLRSGNVNHIVPFCFLFVRSLPAEERRQRNDNVCMTDLKATSFNVHGYLPWYLDAPTLRSLNGPFVSKSRKIKWDPRLEKCWWKISRHRRVLECNFPWNVTFFAIFRIKALQEFLL